VNDIDEKFREVDEATLKHDPTPLSPIPRSGFPEDPPELTKRLVSAIGGECTDLELLPGRFEQFASRTEQTLKALADGMKQLTESVLPLLALQGKRIDEEHGARIALAGRVDRNDDRDDRQDRRLDAVEAELAALRKPAPKAQRPKRAGRKNVR